MDMHEAFIALVTVLIVVVLVALLMAFPVMWLWNYAMVSVFGLPTIGFGQALALNVLSGIFFRTTTSSSNN